MNQSDGRTWESAGRCKKKKIRVDAECYVLLICVLPNLFTRKEIAVRSALDGSCIVLSALPNGSDLSCWVSASTPVLRWLKQNDPFSLNEIRTF